MSPLDGPTTPPGRETLDGAAWLVRQFNAAIAQWEIDGEEGAACILDAGRILDEYAHRFAKIAPDSALQESREET